MGNHLMSTPLPLLTFYVVLKTGVGRRRTRIPLGSLDHYPTDWLELKMMLRDVMERAHIEFKQDEAVVFLERHKPGKFVVATKRGGYTQQKVHFRREYEAVFKARYNVREGSVEVVQTFFTGHLQHLVAEFMDMERGIKYRSPPLIPREHQNILQNPKTMLMEQSATRYADYSRTPRPIYGRKDEEEPRLQYRPRATLQYDRRR
jgi:hypothetical protein